MTKRTAEQTLRDEIDRTNRIYSRSSDDYERARQHVAEATKLLDESRELMESARRTVLRSEAALEALLGETPSLDLATPEPEDVEESRPLDREETIAAVTGVSVDEVREAAKR